MTISTETPAAEGYWTIQVVNQDRGQIGRRYVCRAQDDRQAQSIALLLAGSGRTTVGFDYHRIDNPVGQYARDLAIGQSELVQSADMWAALGSARQAG